MLKHLNIIICIIFIFFNTNVIFANLADMTIKDLVMGEKENFHLRVLATIPKNGHANHNQVPYTF